MSSTIKRKCVIPDNGNQFVMCYVYTFALCVYFCGYRNVLLFCFVYKTAYISNTFYCVYRKTSIEILFLHCFLCAVVWQRVIYIRNSISAPIKLLYLYCCRQLYFLLYVIPINERGHSGTLKCIKAIQINEI